MTMNRIVRLLASLAVVLAGADARAQDFEIEALSAPVPGEEVSATVVVFVDNPSNGTLFYRPTGTTEYQSVIPQLNGNVFSVDIPPSAVTERGLDLYGEYFEDGELRTYPVQNPRENPYRLPVYLGSFDVPIVLAPRQYQMVSVAADLGPGTADGELTDDFGAPNIARWRAARWDPEREAYVEIPESSSSLTEGTAFWLITANGGEFDIDAATSTNPDSLPSITLRPGFNQIGNPYAFPIAWDDVRGEANVGPLLAFDSASNEYFETPTLAPWTGYFVQSFESQPITLTVPPQETAIGGVVRAPRTDYAVHIGARSGAYADRNNVVGFAPAAAAGRDRLDLGEPPPIGDYVRVSVIENGERWMRNLKPVRADGEMWDLEVTASDDLLASGTQRVAVSLHEEGVRPDGFELYLIDRDRGTALQRTDGTFEVALTRDAPVRHLRLISGTEAFARTGSEGAPLEFTGFALDANYPNPFAEQTTISYRLDARGPATLEVFDLLGRRVRVLADGVQNAGPHSVEWDARDGAGQAVSNGLYLVRLRAGDVSATRRASVLR